MNILYEDNDVLVVDKPAGISVHPRDTKDSSKTIVDLVGSKVSDTDVFRPGIVHRLDKGTSGVMIIAKNLTAKDFLKQQFKNRQVEKTYLTLVDGEPELKEAVVELPIRRHPKKPFKRAVGGSGKSAITHYKVLSKYQDKELTNTYSLLAVKPVTGRTHQIRVHLSYLSCPIIGDSTYNKPHRILMRPFLHAHKLRLRLIDDSVREFTSPLPNDLNNFLQSLKRII